MISCYVHNTYFDMFRGKEREILNKINIFLIINKYFFFVK